MREEDVDKILKNKISDEIKAPESLKSRISYEINNMGKKKNNKTKLRVIQSIAAVAVFSILGVTTYAAITKNPILEKLGLIKGNEIYEEVAEDINQDLSNEYAKVTLKRMASDNAYIIMQYNVVLNEKGIEKFGKIGKELHSGYDISINNSIKINDKEIDIAFDRTEYVNRMSDTEYDIYQIIQIANIDSKELKIEISERSLDTRTSQSYINKEIIINATKDENTETFKKIEKKIDNKTITIENFQNTSFETFIKVSVDIENLKKEDIDDFYSERNPNNMSFAVLDTNNNYVPHICYIKKCLYKDEIGNEISGYENEGSILSGNITSHLEYIITLGNIDKEISDIKLIPYISILPDERADDYEEHFNNLEWHKLESGNYKQKNSLGGEIELTKMEASDEKIKFSYNLTGSVTNVETPVLLRVKDERLGFNVIYPTNVYIKDVNAEENYVEFYRNGDVTGVYSKNFEDDEDFKIKDISKVEFALLEKIHVDLLEAQINLKIPEQNNQFLAIKKVETKEIENDDEIQIDERNIINEIVDLPNNNFIVADENNINMQDKEISELEPKVFGENDDFMAGVQLGMTDEEVKTILGEPGCIVTNDIDDTEEQQIKDGFEYQYDNVSIVFAKEDGKNVVDLINTTSKNPQDKGPRGLMVGDTKEDVISAFYCEDEMVVKDEYETDLYRFDNEGYVGHILNDNGFEKIQYYGNFLVFDVSLDINGRVVIMTLQRANDGY